MAHDETALAALLLESIPEGRDAGVVATLRRVVAWIRPRDPSNAAEAVERVDQLAAWLQDQAAVRESLRLGIVTWIEQSRSVPLFAEAGIFSMRGLFGEIVDRLYERILPTPPRDDDLRDAFAQIFDHPRDAEWVQGVPLERWLHLGATVGLGDAGTPGLRECFGLGIAGAIEVLALRVAAEGSETDFLRIDPDVERYDSPFLALQREVSAIHPLLVAHGEDQSVELDRPRHAEVMLAQCLEGVERFRRIGLRRGTSIRHTYLLERMEQQLRRLALLLRAMTAIDAPARARAGYELFVIVVRASATRLSVWPVWEANTGIMARRVTENASRTGEHYATGDRKEYFGMMRAAMGAGALIALMALFKIEVKAQELPPLVDTVVVCADYALGFVIIHLLHFTVATKQPAMTAATIAATIEETGTHREGFERVAILIASVLRTQIVAIFGNIALALPLAAAIALAYAEHNGAPMLQPAKVDYVMHELRPFAGWALLHAAIAGVWLFVAGLISGYFDNRCAVLDIPGRLRGSPLLRWLSPERRDRFAAYVYENMGAIMGNAYFGVLLGATGFLGFLLGLPIDIRHVTFASANLGYAAISGNLGWSLIALGLVFVLMVGAVNLAVSFSLALWVALRSRKLTFRRAPELAAATWALLRRNPREFFLPPAR